MKNQILAQSPFMLKILFGTTDSEEILKLLSQQKENQGLSSENPYHFSTWRGDGQSAVNEKTRQANIILGTFKKVLSTVTSKTVNHESLFEAERELWNIHEEILDFAALYGSDPIAKEYKAMFDKVKQAIKDHSLFAYL